MKKLDFFIIIMAYQKMCVLAKNEEMLHVLTNFLTRRHVQTVTATTCWSIDIDKKFVEKLSFVDISISFNLTLYEKYKTWYRYSYLIDLHCAETKYILKQISDNRLFNSQNDWILFDQNPTKNIENTTVFALRTFETYLGDAYVLPDSSVFLFQEIDNNTWEIWNGFRASKTDKLRVFKMGIASPNYLEINNTHDEKRDFRGITLKALTVIVNKELFFGFDKKISSDLDVFAHMHYEMVHILSDQLNFKIDLGVIHEYGWSFGNGSFGGLIGILQKEAIDFGAAGVLLRSDRMAAVDFTIGTVELQCTVVFRQPSLSSVHNILLLPFKLDVWLLILAIFFIFVFILVILSRTDNKLVAIKKNSPNNVQEIFTLVHGAICQQGSSFKSDLESMRVVIFVLFLTSLFVFTSYSACIAALIQSNSNSIKSIQDLVDSSMSFSVQISPYGKHYLEETEDYLLKKLYAKKISPYGNKSFTRAPEGIERIRLENHGFMVELIAAYEIIGKKWREEEKCGLADVQLFKLPRLSIPLVKKSGHRDLFKQKLIQQLEVGLDKRIVGKWIAIKPSCGSTTRAKQYISVSIKEIYLILKVFGFGVCISVVIFTLEILYHTWKSR